MQIAVARRNIRLSYILAVCYELYFPIAIWIFFFLRYLDFKQITILSATLVIVSILFEIPTGAIADVIGRKTTLILAYALGAISLTMIGFSTTFSMFMFATILYAINRALYSGSLEALLYDTLKEIGKESEYDKVVANQTSIEWIALFCAAVVGGFLYDRFPSSPFFISAILSVIAIGVAVFLHEPTIDSQKYSLTTYIIQTSKGFRELFRDIYHAQLTLLLATIGSGFQIAARILGVSQAREYGLNGQGVGIVFGIGYVVAALASQSYPKIKKYVKIPILILGITTILLSSFLLAKYIGLIFGAVFIISRIATSAVFDNTKSRMINGVVSSKNRATALSTLSLLIQLPYAVFAYMIGSYLDAQSPNAFAFLLGILLFALIGIQLILAYRTRMFKVIST